LREKEVGGVEKHRFGSLVGPRPESWPELTNKCWAQAHMQTEQGKKKHTFARILGIGW